MKNNYTKWKFWSFIMIMIFGTSMMAQEVVNTAFGPGTGSFTLEFDVVPSHSPMNGGVGLSDGDVGAWGDMSCIIGFHTVDGAAIFRAYNGSGYEKLNDITYEAGTSYHVNMSVNVDAQTYNVDITPDGGALTNLATDYAFRKAVTELNIYASYNETNVDYGGVPGATMDVTNYVYTGVFVPKSANIFKADTAPVIDGDASEWADYDENAISYDANSAGSSSEDFSGYWKATWTDTEIYFMAEINDDTLYNAGSAFWNNDAINFYIGLNERNELGASNDPYKNLFNYWWAPGDADVIGTVDTASHVTAFSKWDKADGSGYMLEWSISFEELKFAGYDITFEEGTSFLLDVVAVDDDDDIDIYNVWGWSFDGSSWGNMDNAGDVTLATVPVFPTKSADITKAIDAPVIDGDLADWDTYEAHSIEYDANAVGYDAADFSGYWKATWSDTELFLMADITDDALWNEGTAYWNHDAINFFIGVNERNGLGASNDPNKNMYNYWWAPGDADAIGSVDTASHFSAFKKWDKADGSGYSLEWSISFEELKFAGYDINFEEGTSFLLDVTAVDDDDEIDNFNVWGWSFDGSSWTNMDNTGDVTLAAALFPTKSADIVKTKNAPVIDGDASEWADFEAHAIKYDANGAGSSATDFSGYWKATWTDTELYLMAEINDDSLYNEGIAYWNHDAINFFIGVNERNGLGASNDPNKNMYNYWWAPGDASSIGSVDTSSHFTAFSKWDKADGSGYMLEWSISFEELKFQGYDITFEEGTSFLLDVTAVDDDDEIDNFNVWGWSYDGSSWTNMDNSGDVTLTTPPHPTKSANIAKTLEAPVIDGDIADWDAYEAHSIEYDANEVGYDAADFSAYWKATWTDTELYLMAEITDDALWNEGSAFWNNDALNFFIGVNERNGLGASNDPNKNMYNYWWAPGDADVIGSVDPESEPTAFKKWDKADGSGYIVEWSISFEELKLGGYDINFEEGTSFLLDVTAVDDDDEVDNYNVWGWSFDGSSWTDMDNTGDVTLTGVPFSTNNTTILRTTVPPAIDGDIADWADIAANDIAYDANGIGYDAADFSGYWKATYTDEEMYIMADITDDALWNEGTAYWNHDAVNFYFGLNGRNDLGASNDDHKYLFHYWWAPGDANTVGGIDDAEKVRKWDKADGSGYIIEWKVRFENLNANGADITFEEGSSFLFDVVAVDDDDEIDNHVVWGWSADGASYSNMNNAGDLTLGTLVGVEDFENAKFAVHPNPVRDNMTINGFTNVTSVEIYNLQGQKIHTQSISKDDTEVSIDINTYSPGAYVLRLIGERNYSATIIVKE